VLSGRYNLSGPPKVDRTFNLVGGTSDDEGETEEEVGCFLDFSVFLAFLHFFPFLLLPILPF
jgi:hypothetical protein